MCKIRFWRVSTSVFAKEEEVSEYESWMCVKSLQSCLQARILEWVAMPFSRGPSRTRDQTHVSYNGRWFFTTSAIWKAHESWIFFLNQNMRSLKMSWLVSWIFCKRFKRNRKQTLRKWFMDSNFYYMKQELRCVLHCLERMSIKRVGALHAFYFRHNKTPPQLTGISGSQLSWTGLYSLPQRLF